MPLKWVCNGDYDMSVSRPCKMRHQNAQQMVLNNCHLCLMLSNMWAMLRVLCKHGKSAPNMVRSTYLTYAGLCPRRGTQLELSTCHCIRRVRAETQAISSSTALHCIADWRLGRSPGQVPGQPSRGDFGPGQQGGGYREQGHEPGRRSAHTQHNTHSIQHTAHTTHSQYNVLSAKHTCLTPCPQEHFHAFLIPRGDCACSPAAVVVLPNCSTAQLVALELGKVSTVKAGCTLDASMFVTPLHP